MPSKGKKVVILFRMHQSEDDANNNDVNVNNSQGGIVNAPVTELDY